MFASGLGNPTICPMETIAEPEAQAMQLPQDQRDVLAAQLLGSLPAILHDDAELDSDPSSGQTLQELRQSLGR